MACGSENPGRTERPGDYWTAEWLILGIRKPAMTEIRAMVHTMTAPGGKSSSADSTMSV